MIQILGYRPYTDKNGKIQLTEKFFEKKWRAENVIDLFLNIEKYLDLIPKEYHWNLHYTLAHCHEEPGRKFRKQTVIPYDIDGIDTEKIKDYIKPICQCIGVNETDVGIVNSGNGLHFIVGLHQPIENKNWFSENRIYYKTICERINKTLKVFNLPGEADTVPFASGRTMRLPLTENRKNPESGFPKKNSIKPCELLQRVIAPLEYDLQKVAGLPKVASTSQINLKELKKYSAPDTEYILEECLFLKDCLNSPEKLSEENWYKMLSITARLEDGNNLSHKYSEGHPDYDEYSTDSKIEQALAASGPRTCKNIGESYNCSKCPHYRKSISPITLKGPNYIGTKKNGFRQIRMNKDGLPIKGPVDYDDLEKYFRKKHTYISTTDKSTFVWKDTHWEMMEPLMLDSFAERYVEPAPRNNDCIEFRSKIQRRNIKTMDFFSDTTFRKVNLANGILDLTDKGPVLLPHDKETGFMSTLPYAYDPKATCPRFNQFMKEVTCNRQELEDVLLEFAGYAFANEDCIHAKSLILSGQGRNGKSKFMETLQALAGEGASSAIALTKFQDEKYLAMLQGKLFNLTEETPSKAFMDSSVFKNIVSGGAVTVRHLYKQPFTMRNRAKIILACNELPASQDMTTGMLRRLLIVPFDNEFKGVKDDKKIMDKLLAELPGILNRVLESFYSLRDRGSFTSSAVIDESIDNYRLENDAVLGFYRENLSLEKGDDTYSSISDVFKAYEDYCEDSGIRYPLTKIKFSRELRRCVHDLDKRKIRKKIRGKTVACFQGLKLINGTNF